MGNRYFRLLKNIKLGGKNKDIKKASSKRKKMANDAPSPDPIRDSEESSFSLEDLID